MSTNENALIDINLNSNGGHVLLYSVDEIVAWLHKEREYWSWAVNPNFHGQNIERLLGSIRKTANDLDAHATAIQKQASEEVRQQRFRQVNNFILSTYRENSIPHSSTATAKFLLTISKEDPISAIHALGYFMNIQTAPFPKSAMIGYVRAYQFEKDLSDHTISDATANSRDSLDELYRDLSESLAQQRTEFVDLSSSVSTTIQELGILFSSQQERFNSLFETTTKNNKIILSANKQELERIERTYDEKLALSAPGRYWSKKRIAHEKLSWGFGITAGLLFLIIALFVPLEVHSLLGDTGDAARIPYWRIGVLVVFSTLAIWILRIVVRLFLSHIHLESDAAERVTMLHTYLALLRKEGGLGQDDTRLILDALFRPSSDGIVRDDSAPPGVYDFLSRLAQRS